MQTDLIRAATETGGAAQTPSTQATDAVGREDFLRMLIAQLEHQDPLDPQDATEFTAQLAQFSSLDQLVSMRGGIDSLVAGQGSADAISAANLIGHDALVQGSRFEIGAPGDPLPTLTLDVASAAEITGVEILDAHGGVVARTTTALGNTPAGRLELDWNSFDRVPTAGIHSYRVNVAPGDAAPRTLVRAPVTGAALDPAGTVLLMGGVEVPLAALEEIGR
jgi:flagellar basal-body rod modification protein FlgD